jgi:hypothetical protein
MYALCIIIDKEYILCIFYFNQGKIKIDYIIYI